MNPNQVYTRIQTALVSIYEEIGLESFKSPGQAGLYSDTDEPVDSPWGFVIRKRDIVKGVECDYWFYLNHELQFAEEDFQENDIELVCDIINPETGDCDVYEFESVATLVSFLMNRFTN